MPCDSIQTMTVKLEKANLVFLKKALEQMKLTVTLGGPNRLSFRNASGSTYGDYANGQFTMMGRQLFNMNVVKQNYSHQVIMATAMQFGWKLRKTGPNTYAAVKR